MGLTKVLAAAGGAVVLAGGITVATVRGGGDTTPTKAPTTTTVQVTGVAGNATGQSTGQAAAAPGTPDDVLKSVLALTQQVEQQANNSGQPRALTQEEIDALIKAQLQELGIKL